MPLRFLAPIAGVSLAGLVLAACVAPSEESDGPPPEIAYAQEIYDTVGEASAHAPTLGGGTATRFRIEPALPEGYVFDTATGAFSGTPLVERGKKTYRVIAEGPGGSDTARFGFRVIIPNNRAIVSASIRLKSAAGFAFARAVLDFQSDVAGDPVVRDTIPASQFWNDSLTDPQKKFSASHDLKSPRTWTLRVRVFDVLDSLIYADFAQVTLQDTKSRDIEMELEPRYRHYDVRFVLPDSVGAEGGAFKMKLPVYGFRVFVDGLKARDTVKVGGGFFTSALTHDVPVRYVPRKAQVAFGVHVMADLAGWNAKPAYADTFLLDTRSDIAKSPFVLPWTGPGSPSDPDWKASNPAGAAIPGLNIFILPPPSRIVIPDIDIDTTLFKRK